jgi:16S rRNA (guanine527-N7)-methyltransferase
MTAASRGGWRQLPGRARELFGIELQEPQLAAFASYLDLLERWSARMNLVAERSRDDIVDRHLLDSLALHRWTKAAHVVADVGSGAGFPVVPLATLSQASRFHSIESRTKRATFLRQVVRSLRLRNAEVWNVTAEQWASDDALDLVIGRAVAIDRLAKFARRVLGENGALVVMRKADAAPIELTGFRESERLQYRLPGGEQHAAIRFARAD